MVASPVPLVELEEELSALQRPAAPAPRGEEGRGSYHRLSTATTLTLRGIGAVVEREESTETVAASRLFDRARELAEGAEQVRGVWIRQLDLDNPSKGDR